MKEDLWGRVVCGVCKCTWLQRRAAGTDLAKLRAGNKPIAVVPWFCLHVCTFKRVFKASLHPL